MQTTSRQCVFFVFYTSRKILENKSVFNLTNIFFLKAFYSGLLNPSINNRMILFYAALGLNW